ncbi:MAG TPA: LytTR family DNA-binding domain-containing protein [Longimicrobium sp.]
MTPLRALVVDDEPAARLNLRRLLGEAGGVAVAGECGDGASALERIRAGGVDVIFLDIAMPELDGLEVARAIDAADAPDVVFVTAYDEHALAAFDAHAAAYLLKPVRVEKLAAVLDRLRVRRARPGGTPALDEIVRAVEAARADRYATRLALRGEGRTRFLDTAEVDWIEADDDGVLVHAGGRAHPLRERISELEARLSPREFVRVHRSAIVRIDRVQEIQPWFRGDHLLILTSGARIRSGRTYRQAVQRLLGHH